MTHNEVITFGEAMIRLSPPGFHRLEQARSLDIKVGGAELNAAVALVRLGRSAGWVSRLTNNAIGRLLIHEAKEAGVHTEHVLWTEHDRVGLYFLEFGAAPRASSVLYDRKGSSIAGVKPGMINWSKVFTGVKAFHVTGITPALSQSAAEATHEALQAAKAAGLQVSIDLNYRSKLWSTADANQWMTHALPLCDVLITTEEDAEKVLKIKGKDFEELAALLAKTYSLKVVAVTIRANPLVWLNQWTAIAYSAEQVFRTKTYEVEIVDRLGAGDSFAAGLIHGLLDGDVQKGLDYGVAISALKHSVPGDFAWVTRDEVEALLKGGGLRISR